MNFSLVGMNLHRHTISIFLNELGLLKLRANNPEYDINEKLKCIQKIKFF